MNALDNIERTLEEWGQNLRGGGTSTQGLQPRDVLHTVLESLEQNRVEGLDHKIYAPNNYTVELRLDDEERARLMPFLGHEELEAAIQRYCQERKYHFRGPVALQVLEAGPAQAYAPELHPRGTHVSAPAPVEAKKVAVQSRFDVPQNWDSDLANQFATPADGVFPATEHDLSRRDFPTYADRKETVAR
jgi:hypothetical protein